MGDIRGAGFFWGIEMVKNRWGLAVVVVVVVMMMMMLLLLA